MPPPPAPPAPPARGSASSRVLRRPGFHSDQQSACTNPGASPRLPLAQEDLSKASGLERRSPAPPARSRGVEPCGEAATCPPSLHQLLSPAAPHPHSSPGAPEEMPEEPRGGAGVAAGPRARPPLRGFAPDAGPLPQRLAQVTPFPPRAGIGTLVSPAFHAGAVLRPPWSRPRRRPGLGTLVMRRSQKRIAGPLPCLFVRGAHGSGGGARGATLIRTVLALDSGSARSLVGDGTGVRYRTTHDSHWTVVLHTDSRK